MTWRFHWQDDGRYFVVWQMFMLCINCYLSGKIYSSIKTIIIFFKCRNFRPRINNAINMRLLWLTFVIQCAFVFVIYTLLWGVSFICQVTLFHCTRLSCTLNIKSTKKRLRFGFLIIQLIIVIFFSFLVLLSPYYLWYIFLTSIVWLPNMYMYGVGIDNHEEQIFQESSNVCKMIFLKIKFASYS